MTTAAPEACLCPYHVTAPNTPWRELPELHPIVILATPVQEGEQLRHALDWACLPCANRLAKHGSVRRAIEERG